MICAKAIRAATGPPPVEARAAVYHGITNEFIRDKLVIGLFDQSTRVRIMRERTLTLDTAIEIVRATEMANKQLSKLVTTLPLHVSAVNKPTHNYIGPQICNFCGDKHERGADRCPAYGKSVSSAGN